MPCGCSRASVISRSRSSGRPAPRSTSPAANLKQKSVLTKSIPSVPFWRWRSWRRNRGSRRRRRPCSPSPLNLNSANRNAARTSGCSSPRPKPMPETFSLSSAMPASAADVYAWHARPAAFLRLLPPWERIDVFSQTGSFAEGKLAVAFRAPCFGPIRHTWKVEFSDFEPDRGFQYRQVRGPFSEWIHTHRFLADGDRSSTLENKVEYRLPFGAFGHAFAAGPIEDRVK